MSNYFSLRFQDTMKALIWHCKRFRVGNIEHSTRMAPIDYQTECIDETNAITVWVTVETKGDINFLEELMKDIELMCEIHGTNNIIIAPFAHLSELHCKRKNSYSILKNLAISLKDKGLVVKLVHFGSYKDMEFFSESHAEQVRFRTYPKPVWKSSLKSD